MRSGDEDGAHYSGIAPEEERALQALRGLRVSPQLFRRNNKETPPQTIATRTNERVRDQSPHAVAEHDDVVCRKIGILRIDNANRPLKLLAQPERVEQDRCAGTIIEVPELKAPRDLGIAFQGVHQLQKRERRRLQTVHEQNRDLVRIVWLAENNLTFRAHLRMQQVG